MRSPIPDTARLRFDARDIHRAAAEIEMDIATVQDLRDLARMVSDYRKLITKEIRRMNSSKPKQVVK